MKAKKRGAEIRCHFALPDWAARRIFRPKQVGYTRQIMSACVGKQSLTYDCWEAKSPLAATQLPADAKHDHVEDCYAQDIPRALVERFDKVASAHGLTRKQALSFAVKWTAMHLKPNEMPAGKEDWEHEGEDWKNA